MVRTVEVWYSPDVWKKPIWYTLTIAAEFADGVANLEKINVSESIWDPGIWAPGMWETTIFDEILEKMK